jgi:ATP-binding cassette subfamily C protein
VTAAERTVDPGDVLGVLRAIPQLIDRGHRLRWLSLIVLAVVVSVFEVVSALLTLLLLRLMTTPEAAVAVPFLGNLADLFPEASQRTITAGVAICTAIFFVLRACLTLVQAYAQSRLAFTTGAALSTRLLRGYLLMPYSFHLRRNSSELIRNAYSSVSEVVATAIIPIVTLTSDLLVVIGIVAVLLSSAPVATLLVVLVLGPSLFLLLRVVQPRLVDLGEQHQGLFAESLQAMQQSLEGLRDIRVLGREDHFAERFGASRHRLARVQYTRALLGELPRVAVETGLIVFIVAFLLVTVLAQGDTAGSLAVLALFAYAALRLLPSLNRIVANLNNLRFGSAAVRDVLQDLRLVGRIPDRAGPVEPLAFREQIALHDLEFSYEGAAAPALRGVELVIRHGESLGVVGATGAGKSTLIDILLGLLAPTRGEVLVDDVALRGREASWHARLGVVPQAIFLVDDTLRRNVALGRRDDEIDDAAVEEAVRLAQLTSFVAELPDGLQTHVGERGVRLSGGQRQRVAIARALYRRPSVLVFDEGTSALDNLTEREFVAALERLKGDRTIITVAHRLSTVRACDRIVLMEGGRIVAAGTYDSLLADNEAFRRMAR